MNFLSNCSPVQVPFTTETRRARTKNGGPVQGSLSILYEQELTGEIIGAAIEVHRELGPRLLESAYEECLCHELHQRCIVFQRQVPLAVAYKSIQLGCGYRADLVVDDKVIVELKTVDSIAQLHKAQLLTYLRISGKKVGLLFNFNSVILKDSMVRLVL